ncbi:hypothetical protein ULMS_15110 [Patiriisocius marinistellae]|uniref:Lipoprotein n=1 Tax=Patiriisocius marinistellae TaxID=2494560 RepID=A0A5J4FVQ3_9FLAO|nr:hypothetical protein [Patiriisocius marinistellae]GEQ86003.1 hypothetical protein ULMS_15110 [Patiriisocius marinistellae]
MRKVFIACAVLAFFASCTPESTLNLNEQQTDKDKNCPPNDTNCNGIPDNKE